MRVLILMLIFLLSINQNFCQETNKEVLDEFFKIYKDDPAKAVDYIYSNTKWIDGDGDSVKQLKSKLSQYKELIGEYYGAEFLYKGELGKCFETYIYLAKYDRQPFRFTFEFYKPKDQWIVYSFKFDDSFDDDLEKAILFEYMPSNN